MKHQPLLITSTLLLANGALASHRTRNAHNRLDSTQHRITIHNKKPNYHPNSMGKTYPAKRAVPPCQDGWHMGGCIEDSDDRIMPDYAIKMPNDTPANCVSHCDGKGYTYAGVEYGDECWCGNDFSRMPMAADPSECNMPCAGDDSLPCGDGYRMLWFTKDTNPPSPSMSASANTTKRELIGSDDSSSWKEGPCMVDQNSPRLLKVLAATASEVTQMSPDRCLSQCASQGMDLAGLQDGSECWCGNSLTLNDGEQPWAREANPEECMVPCGTNGASETCGGPWRLRLFGNNGALEKYGFGFTRSSPTGDSSSTSSTSSPTSAQSQVERRQEALLTPPKISLPGLEGIATPNANAEAVAGKKVIAHHMVGNTYPYTIDNWLSDVTLAKSNGIDGFALNLGAGGNSWQRSRVGDAFTAAQTMGGFGMIFSFDMTVLPCNSQNDADTLRDYIKTWGPHPGHLTIPPADGSAFQRIVVSTFAGEDCKFGTGSVHDGWLSVIQDHGVVNAVRAAGRDIAFVPSWFARVESRKQEFTGVVQGDFHWNGGWPAGNNDINWDTDSYRLQNNPGPLYMASVSPWFFTHYGPNSFNKNWIYRGDDWLYAERWDLLFEHRSQVDLVEIVTWNDYGESSYIGPIEGDQPNSQAWVDGYPHLGFLEMTAYYAQAYKTGSYPPITEDKVYIWSRPHPRDATASQDPVGRPNNSQWTEDYVWGLVFATSVGQFTLKSGSNSKTFDVVAGINKFKVPNSPGQIRGTLSRVGMPIVDVNPGNAFTYTNSPTTYNFNNFIASN